MASAVERETAAQKRAVPMWALVLALATFQIGWFVLLLWFVLLVF